MGMPVIVCVMLYIPVVYAWARERLSQGSRRARLDRDLETQPSKPVVDWEQRLESTIDVFWNTFMFWLFSKIPTLFRISLQVLQT